MKFYNHRAGGAFHVERNRFDLEDGCEEPFSRNRHGGSRKGYGGRGEGKRFFERGKFKIALLELLASEPMHGYQLIKAMEEKTGGLYTPSPGSIYPNLQLLEDMQLVGCSESDGRKLYRITDEGLAYLREQGDADAESRENRREHRRPRDGRLGKQQLRGLMKEWSEVVYLMAKAADAAKENPSSPQAAQFQELMDKLLDSLAEMTASAPNDGAEDESERQAPPKRQP